MSKAKGTVKFFNTQKGFGFITPEDGSPELFVHISKFAPGVPSLHEGQRVEYLAAQGRKGPEATEVRPV